MKTPTGKQIVICMIRVSTDDQDLERQRENIEDLISKYNLENIRTFELKVSGTAVQNTREYKELLKWLARLDVVGLIVPTIDRWFRAELLSEIGDYVRPFEEMTKGQPNKRLFCDLGILDPRNKDDQKKIMAAAQYASDERIKILLRTTQGKNLGRNDAQMKIDPLPDWVEFLPFESDHKDYKKGKKKGYFFYNDFARNSVLPLFLRFWAGEALAPLATELDFGSIQNARVTLRNLWALGIKHRLKHISNKIWSNDKNDYEHRGLIDHERQFRIRTNLADTPLVSQEIFDAVQDRLGVRKTEYGKRKKTNTDFLVSTLLHCKKCGAVMYPRRGGGGARVDTYKCATRNRHGQLTAAGGKLREESCDAPIFRRIELDKEVTHEFITRMSHPKMILAKIEESFSVDQQAEAQMIVAQKQRILALIEKKIANVESAIEVADDPRRLTIRLNELNREAANARLDVATSKEGVSEAPVIDRAALRHQISQDVLAFQHKPVIEQRAILAKYVESITAQLKDSMDEDSGEESGPNEYEVTFHMKVPYPIVPTAGRAGGSGTKSGSYYSA